MEEYLEPSGLSDRRLQSKEQQVNPKQETKRQVAMFLNLMERIAVPKVKRDPKIAGP